MKTKTLLLVATIVAVAGCSTTEKYQYVWRKDGSTPEEAQEVSTSCGNSIGENTISTEERQDSFHECMRSHGYKLHRLKKY